MKPHNGVYLRRRERKVSNLTQPEPSSHGGYRRNLAFERIDYGKLEAVLAARRLLEDTVSKGEQMNLPEPIRYNVDVGTHLIEDGESGAFVRAADYDALASLRHEEQALHQTELKHVQAELDNARITIRNMQELLQKKG